MTKSDYHNYSEDNQYPKYIIQGYDIQIEYHDVIERQIRTDKLLLQQVQEEERKQAVKGNCQIDYDDPLLYHKDRDQVN